MQKARILTTGQIITADDIKAELFPRNLDFVDVEEEFRVTFVKAAKCNGGPYFRLYYCLEEYKKFSPDQKRRYDILSDMRHYDESPWHKDWEAKVEDFCEIEKTIRDPDSKSYKRADAFNEKYNLCIEFQHSYIANDFQIRNEFYSKLGYKTIWLYDLTQHNSKEYGNGVVEIVEDNARGFFRIAEEELDLSKYPVFIQVRDGTIYKVNKLFRKQINKENKSTIRYFYKSSLFTEEEFIEAIKICNDKLFKTTQELCSIPELWNKSFCKMIVQDAEKGDQLIFYGKNGKINRDFASNEICMNYRYVEYHPSTGYYTITNERFYSMKPSNYNKKKFRLLGYFQKK